MSKLNKNVAERIAHLVNTMNCANIMIDSMAAEEKWDSVDYYRNQLWAVIIVLADDYGIELPTLGMAREQYDEGIYKLRWVKEAA